MNRSDADITFLRKQRVTLVFRFSILYFYIMIYIVTFQNSKFYKNSSTIVESVMTISVLSVFSEAVCKNEVTYTMKPYCLTSYCLTSIFAGRNFRRQKCGDEKTQNTRFTNYTCSYNFINKCFDLKVIFSFIKLVCEYIFK